MSGSPLIRIGNQTAFSASSLMAPFHYAVQNGFDAFEWFPDKKPWGGWDETHLDSQARLDIRQTARARDIRLSVHARWEANPLRAEAWPILLRDLELANDLGATLLNIHLETEHGVEAYVRAITPLIQRVAESGLQLSIENTPLTTPQHFNELFVRLRSLDAVPFSHVGMCLDLGHANLCASTRHNYQKYIDELAPDVPIVHLHVHENWGDRDSHLPLFTGPAGRDDSGVRGLIERLMKRAYSGSVILEQWPEPAWLLNQARDRFQQLWLECSRRQQVETRPAAENAEPELRAPAPSALADNEFTQRLTDANQRCRSWREKLDFVRSLFAEDARVWSTENLVEVAVYLRFLGTGEIKCAEDGRHFRPSQHAKISIQIQQRLAALTTPANAWIVRKIFPCLPSSGPEFTRAEPLTRIRDLAHRNDIASELKREIKHTLQNKLHRCAGPADLATSAALLERLTAPGADYSAAFVEQFKIFHAELKEFFNARSLDERLKALAQTAAPDAVALMRRFALEKEQLERGAAAQLSALRTVVELRRQFLAQIKKEPGGATQELLLADIGLEDYSFVLLSELSNALDATQPSVPWVHLIEALTMTLAGLALSGVAPDESRAVESEFIAWRQNFNAGDRDQLLRLKATADRARRLAEDYSDRIIELFPPMVARLGRALGVADHVVKVFSEAEIRGHVVFQLSKLASGLVKHIREAAALPHWDVLVPGQVAGRLRLADSLGEFADDSRQARIALLRNAEGDEEIPSNVAGIILAHELPHLSHLGVRARQGRVAFVGCGDAAKFKELERLAGQWVALDATAEAVAVEVVGEPLASPSKPIRAATIQVPAVLLSSKSLWLELEQATLKTAGGKAAGAQRLQEFARQKNAGFKTPPAIAVPFGVMEECLRAAPAIEAEYVRWLHRLDESTNLDDATEHLRRLIRQLEVPGALVAAVTNRFGADERLMVRSSANCEDLEKMAGAGLYDSVANVAPMAVAAAVREVWASLWTQRATESRRQAGVPHDQAHIAVLIQRMIAPDLSFTMHTVNPISRNAGEAYVELAVGLGETLASAATRGNPWRLVCDKASSRTTMLAFANFSDALWPHSMGGLTRRIVDYSRMPLTQDSDLRRPLGARLAAIARAVEIELGRPQDIEGVITGEDIFLVQSRPQQGLGG